MGSQYNEFCTERITPVEAQTREISSITMEYAMWSKPAPPSDSGNATPVRPSSAALRNVSRGKFPVSSISRASGFTSFSANSRTVRCSSFCSSFNSRFNGLLRRISAARESRAQRPAKFCIRRGKVFRFQARFADRSHEVCVASPSGQQMHVQMIGDARAGRTAQIHAEVVSFGMIDRIERRLHALRKLHDFGGRFVL